MPNPLIAIIIVNWNGCAHTLECISSVQNIDYANFKIIVIDNGSSDTSLADIQKRYPDVTCLPMHQNLGFAEGSNVGIRYALALHAERLFLLNNDTIVKPDVLKAFMRQNDPVMGGKLFCYQDRNKLDHLGGIWNEKQAQFDLVGLNAVDNGQFDQPMELDYVCGASLFAHRTVFEKIGLLEPAFFLFWEESDWCYRAKKAGFTVKTCPQAVIYHKGSASFIGNKSHTTYFDWRNRLLWIKRNCDFKTQFNIFCKILLPEIAKLYRHRFLFIFRNQLDYQSKKKRLQSALQGIKDFAYARFGNAPHWIYSNRDL